MNEFERTEKAKMEVNALFGILAIGAGIGLMGATAAATAAPAVMPPAPLPPTA